MLPQTAVPFRPAGLPPVDSPCDRAGRLVGRDGGPDLVALGRVGGGGPVARLGVHGMGVRSAQPARLFSLPGGPHRGHRRRVTGGPSALDAQQSPACQTHSYLRDFTFLTTLYTSSTNSCRNAQWSTRI